MAGGTNAAAVGCMQCGQRAERTVEGLETDHYRCAAGHEFGIDWSYDGPPASPQWPPPPDFLCLDDVLARRRGPR